MKKATATKQRSDSDQHTFQQLYQKYHDVVYSICLRMTQNISEAEDLTQDVFVQLFRTIGSFRGESAFTTWLHRLTVNCVLMHFRKNRRRLQSEQLTDSLEVVAQLAVSNKRPSIVDRI